MFGVLFWKCLLLINYISSDILNSPGSVLVDDYDCKTISGKTYLFTNPAKILTAEKSEDICAVIQEIEKAQSNGMYAAGYISYDSIISQSISSNKTSNIPFIWMGIYDKVQEFDYFNWELDSYDSLDKISNIHLNISEAEYLDCIKQIKEYISSGDIYQANYTCKLLFDNYGLAAGLFGRLRKAHPVNHSAFINTGDFQIISLSPELFLRKTGNKIITKPMKGTCKRGRYYDEDMVFADFLRKDPKNTAENLMIVDLMRNDLGRICEYGGVKVPKLFEVEHYKSVLQMVSEVEGVLKPDTSLLDILKASFPPGSVTGAPKIRAMEIIDELEKEARGVYCGCIGMFKPGGDILLNVAIRTIMQKESSCEMGIGSGIVADSDPKAELKETLLKSSFLMEEPVDFEILETMLFNKDSGYYLLDEHLKRMEITAKYFGFKFNRELVSQLLTNAEITMQLDNKTDYRVRILSFKDGRASVEFKALEKNNNAIKIVLSERRIDADDIFLYNKTTNRKAYDLDLADAVKKGFGNVLYLNTEGFITECATCNICILLNGKWITPALKNGLLPGLWRAELLKSGFAAEANITLDDLRNAEAIMIGNSTRGGYDGEIFKTTKIGKKTYNL